MRVPGASRAPEPLHVHAQQRAWPRPLVAAIRLPLPAPSPGEPVPGQHLPDRRTCTPDDPRQPPRSEIRLSPRPQDLRLLRRRQPTRRPPRSTRTITQTIARLARSCALASPALPPAMRRRRRDAESVRGRSQRRAPLDRLDQRLTARQSELRISVQLHLGPPLASSSRTDSLRTGPDGPLSRSQRVWAAQHGLEQVAERRAQDGVARSGSGFRPPARARRRGSGSRPRRPEACPRAAARVLERAERPGVDDAVVEPDAVRAPPRGRPRIEMASSPSPRRGDPPAAGTVSGSSAMPPPGGSSAGVDCCDPCDPPRPTGRPRRRAARLSARRPPRGGRGAPAGRPGASASAARLETVLVVELARGGGALAVGRGRAGGGARLARPGLASAAARGAGAGRAGRRGQASSGRAVTAVRTRSRRSCPPTSSASASSSRTASRPRATSAGLLAQQLADLRIRDAAPQRQVEQRPVTRVEIADGGRQAVGRHS